MTATVERLDEKGVREVIELREMLGGGTLRMRAAMMLAKELAARTRASETSEMPVRTAWTAGHWLGWALRRARQEGGRV